MPKSREFHVPSGRLEEHLKEKYPGMSAGEAKMEAERCLYCYDAPCIPACPTEIDIPTFIRKIATGNVPGSARTILDANLLGASCSRVCPVEVLCEGSCVYTGWDKPAIQIGRLQRYAMDRGADPALLPKAAATSKKVALVGAGPASLACAGTLALLGHSPVIFEKGALPGGLNTTGVAPYKMNVAAALMEVAFIQSLGVDIKKGIEIGRDVTGQDLLDQHEAVFLGPGLGGDSRLGVPGEADGEGVVGAVEWIHRMKTHPGFSVDSVRRAAVIGGGNTALDACRELAQLGVPHVYMIYRRGEAEMSGYRHERDDAKREGVVLITHAVVEEIVHYGGRVSAVRLLKAKDGRPTDQPLDEIQIDLVVLAIGQSKLKSLADEFPGVELDDRGRLVADPLTGATGHPRVFAGGDARNGGKEVVNAAAEGQAAAHGIHALLQAR